MTGLQLMRALRALPNDALDQPVIFHRLELNRISDEYEMESVIVDSVQPWSAADDADGNYILLS